MQKRPKPLSIPDRYPFIVVDFGEEGEPHHMRLPSHIAVSRFRGHVEGVQSGEFLQPEQLAVMGLLIGMCWHHKDQQLDATGDGLEYGAEVYEELHAAGYTLNQVSNLYLVLTQAIAQHTMLSKEVIQRAAFFSLAMAKKSSDDSTSASNT